MPSPDPRAVFAALANDAARELYAAHVLGEPDRVVLAPAKRRRALDALVSAGLLDEGGAAPGDVFRALLADGSTEPKPTGPDRFLDADGRIARLPRSDSDRRGLFALIIDRVIAHHEVLDERTISSRIADLHEDVTSLRRDLVDAGFLVRTPTGSAYRRGAGDGAGR